MAKIRFDYDDVKLRGNIDDLFPKLDRAIKATMDFTATEGEAYMKAHAPWTDRTTNARNGLHTVSSSPARGKYEILFAHTVHYGIYLELANSGRYQVIMPSVRHEGHVLMERFRGLLPKVAGSKL